jgi:hypothetical protein
MYNASNSVCRAAYERLRHGNALLTQGKKARSPFQDWNADSVLPLSLT